MSTMASQVTSLTIVYSTIYSGADQRKHQCSMSLAFVRGFHQWPVNFLHKGPVTQKMFPFDDVIMKRYLIPHFYCELCDVYCKYFGENVMKNCKKMFYKGTALYPTFYSLGLSNNDSAVVCLMKAICKYATCSPACLTHWGPDKMATISQTALFKCILLNEYVKILIKISLKLIPKGPINKIPALVQIMHWRRPSEKAIIWTNFG